jgi:hypothetical protein
MGLERHGWVAWVTEGVVLLRQPSPDANRTIVQQRPKGREKIAVWLKLKHLEDQSRHAADRTTPWGPMTSHGCGAS